MSDNKPLKVVFAPGAFDSFDGTQEELDDLMKEINEMFSNKTFDEIKLDSRELSDEDWEELPDDVKVQILRSSHQLNSDDGEDLADEFKRNLQ